MRRAVKFVRPPVNPANQLNMGSFDMVENATFGAGCLRRVEAALCEGPAEADES